MPGLIFINCGKSGYLFSASHPVPGHVPAITCRNHLEVITKSNIWYLIM